MIVWLHSVTGNAVTKTDHVQSVYTPGVTKASMNLETGGLRIASRSGHGGCILSGYLILCEWTTRKKGQEAGLA